MRDDMDVDETADHVMRVLRTAVVSIAESEIAGDRAAGIAIYDKLVELNQSTGDELGVDPESIYSSLSTMMKVIVFELAEALAAVALQLVEVQTGWDIELPEDQELPPSVSKAVREVATGIVRKMWEPDLDPAVAPFLWQGKPMQGMCGHCQVHVDSTDPNHRVTSIVRGGKGVECVLRGDIEPSEGGPLRGLF